MHTLLRLRPVFDYYVFELVVEEFFGGALPCGVDFDEVGENAFGAELAGAAVLDCGQQFSGRLVGVGVVRENVFERLSLGAQARAFGAQLVELLAQIGGFAAAAGETFLGLAAIGGDGLKLPLARGDAFREAAASPGRGAFDFGGGEPSSSFLTAGALALDAGQIGIGLRVLIADGGRFAEKAEDDGA